MNVRNMDSALCLSCRKGTTARIYTSFLNYLLFISEPKLSMIEPLNAMKLNLAVQGSPLQLCIVRCNEYTLCTQINNVLVSLSGAVRRHLSQ